MSDSRQAERVEVLAKALCETERPVGRPGWDELSEGSLDRRHYRFLATTAVVSLDAFDREHPVEPRKLPSADRIVEYLRKACEWDGEGWRTACEIAGSILCDSERYDWVSVEARKLVEGGRLEERHVDGGPTLFRFASPVEPRGDEGDRFEVDGPNGEPLPYPESPVEPQGRDGERSGYDGEICDDCTRPVAERIGSYWRALDDLWAQVVGDDTTILCPRCFGIRAQTKGIHICWQALPEGALDKPVEGQDGEDTHDEFTIRWDNDSGEYKVSVPNLNGPLVVVPKATRDERDRELAELRRRFDARGQLAETVHDDADHYFERAEAAERQVETLMDALREIDSAAGLNDGSTADSGWAEIGRMATGIARAALASSEPKENTSE